MSGLNETEYSRKTGGGGGRRNRGAKIFFQDSEFFEKVIEKPNSRMSNNASINYDNDSATASPVLSGLKTHRSTNKNKSPSPPPPPPLITSQPPPPPVKPRTKIYESTKTFNDYSNNSNNNNNDDEAIKLGTEVADNNSTILNGIFTYENKSIDLELSKNFIKWKFISDNKRKQLKSECKYDLCEFFSVEPKFEIQNYRSRSRSRNYENMQQSTNKNQQINSADSSVNGFILFYFQREKYNIYRPKKLIFEHPHSQTCHDWITRLRELMPVLKNHRQVLIILNPFAGERKTRSIFNSFLIPLFNTARIKYKIIEFHDNLNLKDNLVNNNICFSDYYGIVIMAGDSALNHAINVIIQLTVQEDDDLNSIDLNDISNKLKTPICIIPCGAINMIANSIYGSIDHISPLMFLLYGKTIKIDLSTIYTGKDKLHSFGFNTSAGFGATMARYILRYAKFGINKVQTSIARGTAKQSHRLVNVEISYLLNDDPQSNPKNEEICVKGCKTCCIREHNVHIKHHDEVENYENSSFRINENNNKWKTIRDSFIHIAFVSNAALGLNTSIGQSKYAHLGDGCIDMILVSSVAQRKDFYRFIKRHTNLKNQLDLPFVKAIRIKEARIKILNNITSTNNLNVSPSRSRNLGGGLEMSDENNSDDLENDNDDDYKNQHDEMATEITNNPHRSFLNEKSTSKFYFIRSIDDIKNENKKTEAADEDNPGPFYNDKKRHSVQSKSLLKNSRSIKDLLNFNSKKSKEFIDNNETTILNSSRIKSGQKMLKSPMIWNLDWNLYSLPEIHLKCNRQFLPVFAQGIDQDTDFSESSGSLVSCLSPI